MQKPKPPRRSPQVSDQHIIRQECRAGGRLDEIHARSEVALGRRLTFEELLLVSTILEHPVPQ